MNKCINCGKKFESKNISLEIYEIIEKFGLNYDRCNFCCKEHEVEFSLKIRKEAFKDETSKKN